MKTLIVYSSLTGNTKSLCERVFRILTVEKEMVAIEEVKKVNMEEFSTIILGFWCDKGTMDASSLQFLKTIQDKNIFFLGTLGAKPESEHGEAVFENAKALCMEKNSFQDGILIWGRISKAIQDRIRQFPADHPHGPNPERIARWEAAESHPNENDFKAVEEFFSARIQ